MHHNSLIIVLVCLLALAGPASGQEAAEPSVSPSSDGVANRAGAESKSESEAKPRSRGGVPDDIAGLQQMAIEAYESGNYLRFVQATIKLRNLRPYEPQYLIGMVVGTSLLGRQASAYSYMHKMQQQGLSFDFNSTEDTQSIRGTEVYDYINDLLVKAGDPLGEGEVAFTLPERARYPEAIAWDPSRERFLVGAADTGEVLAVTPDGEVETLLEPQDEYRWWAVHGIAVDPERNRLWLSSAALPVVENVTRDVLGRTELLSFELDSLEPVSRHPVTPDGLPHVLGSIAVMPNGDVYAIDRAMPVLYRKAADGKSLDPFLGSRELVGFRDIVATPDGSRLYVADAALGILVVDPEAQQSGMLSGPETLNLGGLSGLMWAGDALLTVQNGIRPQRVMRLELDPDGRTVTDVKPIANALPGFNYPSFGVVHDEAAWYFASGNAPGANEGPVAPVIMKSPLELEDGFATPEQNKFREDTFGPGPGR